MRKLIASLAMGLGVSLASVAGAAPADADAVPKAQQVAQGWLQLTDSSQYAASWDQAANPFRAAISKTDWERAIGLARTPLGALEKRELISANYTDHLPGAPDGQYVVIQFSSRFANKKSAIETITPMKDADGQWKVAGYFIK